MVKVLKWLSVFAVVGGLAAGAVYVDVCIYREMLYDSTSREVSESNVLRQRVEELDGRVKSLEKVPGGKRKNAAPPKNRTVAPKPKAPQVKVGDVVKAMAEEASLPAAKVPEVPNLSEIDRALEIASELEIEKDKASEPAKTAVAAKKPETVKASPAEKKSPGTRKPATARRKRLFVHDCGCSFAA